MIAVPAIQPQRRSLDYLLNAHTCAKNGSLDPDKRVA